MAAIGNWEIRNEMRRVMQREGWVLHDNRTEEFWRSERGQRQRTLNEIYRIAGERAEAPKPLIHQHDLTHVRSGPNVGQSPIANANVGQSPIANDNANVGQSPIANDNANVGQSPVANVGVAANAS